MSGLGLLVGCGQGPELPPKYSAQSVASHGSSNGGSITLGRHATIYGEKLGPEKVCEGSEIELCGTAVRIGTENVLVTYASPGQVNFLVPDQLVATGEAELRVLRRGVAGPAVRVQLLTGK